MNMQRRQNYRKGDALLIMNPFEICNIRIFAMPAFFHMACCINSVCMWGRTDSVVKVSEEHN